MAGVGSISTGPGASILVPSDRVAPVGTLIATAGDVPQAVSAALLLGKEQILKDLLKEKEVLQNENRLLEDHLMRAAEHSPSRLEDLQSGAEDEEEISEYGSRSSLAQSSPVGGSINEMSDRREGSLFSSETNEEHNLSNLPLPRLNGEEKNDIASKENAGLREEMEKCRNENERILDELRAAYDESALRIGEVRRDRADFQRDVMADTQNKGFKKANAHKVLKYLKGKIKYKVAKAKKIHERNQALHVVIARTEKQLSMKKELADVLHAVDFEQLHIHKQQNQQRLREKTHELQRLKSSLLKATEALETTSQNLADLLNNGNKTIEDLNTREPQLAHVEKDIHRVTLKKERLEELLHVFMQERDAQLGESQPNVLDYMQLKAKVYTLHQEYKTWLQKVDIAEMCSHHASTQLSEKDAIYVDDMIPYKSS